MAQSRYHPSPLARGDLYSCLRTRVRQTLQRYLELPPSPATARFQTIPPPGRPPPLAPIAASDKRPSCRDREMTDLVCQNSTSHRWRVFQLKPASLSATVPTSC